MGTHPIFESDFDCLTEKWFLEHADHLVKVTIVIRGRALGFAIYQPSDMQLMPEEQILDCHLQVTRRSRSRTIRAVDTIRIDKS